MTLHRTSQRCALLRSPVAARPGFAFRTRGAGTEQCRLRHHRSVSRVHVCSSVPRSLALGTSLRYVSVVSTLLAGTRRPPPAALRAPPSAAASRAGNRSLASPAARFFDGTSCPKKSDCGCPPASRRGGAGFAPTRLFCEDKINRLRRPLRFNFHFSQKTWRLPQYRNTNTKKPRRRGFLLALELLELNQTHLRIALKIKTQSRYFSPGFNCSQLDNPIVFIAQFFNRGVYNPTPDLPEVINAWRYFE